MDSTDTCVYTVLARVVVGFNGRGALSPAADGLWANNLLTPMCIFKIRKVTMTSSEVPRLKVLRQKDSPLCFLSFDKILIFFTSCLPSSLSQAKPANYCTHYYLLLLFILCLC